MRKIAIIAQRPENVAGDSWVHETLGAWAGEAPPAVETLGFDQVMHDDSSLDAYSAAWVLAAESEPAGFDPLMALLQDRHIPTMVTRPREALAPGEPLAEGVVACPADQPPALACAVLRSLWSQAGVLKNLQRELKFLHAHQGGLCDQIGKIDEELRLAAQLQREFLPHELPRVGLVEFHALFRPAGYVSGDIYDVVRLDEHHVGVFIADAVGHGVPAALMTMYIKRCLQTKTIDPGSPGGYRITSPDAALAHLNVDMCNQPSTGKIRFATACYAVVNCNTLEMLFARAGHPFPLVLHADGTSTHLEPDGAMLGIFPEEVFQLQRVQLQAGDRLLFYSDGFELAFPQEGEGNADDRAARSTQQYTQEFKDLANGSLEAALARLVANLDQQAGSLNQQDDMTVVALAVHGEKRARGRSGFNTSLTEANAI